MAEYLGALIGVGAIVALCEHISYGGELDKNVKVALGIILLSSLVSPLVSALDGLSSFDIDSLFNKYGDDIAIEDSLYYKTAEEAFCVGIERLLDEELGIEGEDIEVYTEGFDMTEMRAEKITIILSGKGAYADYRKIESRISSLGLGKCEVKLEFG